jgi:hypothetical protein
MRHQSCQRRLEERRHRSRVRQSPRRWALAARYAFAVPNLKALARVPA